MYPVLLVLRAREVAQRYFALYERATSSDQYSVSFAPW